MTPDTIEAALARVLAVRDCPAARRLCADCWAFAREHGEAAGLSMAAVVLAGVGDYQRHEYRLRPLAAAGLAPGLEMAERPVPLTAGYWWISHAEVVAVDGTRKWKGKMQWAGPGAPAPEGATHWTVEGEPGWWRVPRKAAGGKAA